jgi:ankyrin repeat protein
MKKFLIIAMVLLLSILVLYSITKDKPKTLIVPISDKTFLFSSGTEKQIRRYLESSDASVGGYQYYLLIINDRTDILEMLFRDYHLDPNFSIQYNDDTPLIDAARELKKEAVGILIKYGADVNYADKNGDTALILASNKAFAIPTYKEASREISKILIDAGADLNVVGKRNTPLDGAMGSIDMVNVKYMVDHGAKVDFLDSDGANYLFGCFSFECMAYFLDHGLNINSVNNRGQSFFQSAVRSKIENVEEVKKLIDLGADICHKDNEGLNVLNYIEVAGINPHKKTENPDFYYKEVEKHKNKEHYKYLEKEYNKRCLESLKAGNE